MKFCAQVAPVAVQLISCALTPHSLWSRACVLGCWRRPGGDFCV